MVTKPASAASQPRRKVTKRPPKPPAPPPTHMVAALVTIKAAEDAGAVLPASLCHGLLGLAQAWDEAEVNEAWGLVAGLSRQILDYLAAVEKLVPVRVDEDEFEEIGRHLRAVE